MHDTQPSQNQSTSRAVQGRSGAQGEGPFMYIALEHDGEKITRADFDTYGCPYAIACGDWLTGWVKGKTVEQAQVITPSNLSRMLGGLPLGKGHCAEIAIEALHDGLVQLNAN